MRIFTVTLFLFLISDFGFSQQTELNWNASFETNRSFIENKGQFDSFNSNSDSPILYALDGGAKMVLFTKDGFTFRFAQKEKNKNRKRGDRTTNRYNENVEEVTVSWANASSNRSLKAINMLADKHTYAMLNADRTQRHVENVYGYQKLVYENVYPNIDIEFEIHEVEGFKYNIILHPGADVSAISMVYPKAYSPTLDKDGNLMIRTQFGNVIDHAPSTFYDGTQEVIDSKFVLNENHVGFGLSSYDVNRKVVVDPWVTTPSFPNSGGIWDIDVDDLGNVYIYGGDTPMRLQKYDAAGALQWTYNTPWDSANYWIGTMITEPTSGDCFITAGTDPVASRISTAGSPVWTANGGALDEYWKLSFNCDNTRLFLGGTRLSLGGLSAIEGYGYVFEIDMNTGAQLNNAEIASVTPGPLGLVSNPNEVRAMCPSPNGYYYYMTLDTIGRFDENLNLGYQENHGYSFSYQVAGYGVTNQSINAMAATTDFIYTLDGSTVDKRNIVDGSIVASAPIPNGNTTNELGFNSTENGGLELDSCDNVFVGSGTGVYKFDENLNQLAFQSTPGRVYDVAVNSAGEVVACGQGFAASLDLEPCAPPKAVCLNCLELTPAGPYCPSDAQDTLMANPGNGVWSGPGITDAVLGIFDPAVADTGTHVIYFAPEIPLECGIDSLVIEVNYCVDLQACIDSLGNIAVPNGIPPYTWSQTIDTVDCSACFPAAPPIIQGCSIPPGCAVQTTVVQEFSNDTTVTPTGNWPIFVEDSEGNTLEIPSLASLPACSQGCFIVVNLPDTVVACLGDSAQATPVVFGAIGTASYSWNTIPEQTNATAIGLAPGSYYTVTVIDDSMCVAIDSVYVIEEECVGPIVCATPFGDMSADGVGPFTWYEYTDSTDCSTCLELPGFPPCTFPPGCAVTVQGYQQFAVGDLVTPTGNWPVAVVDAAGDTLFINSLAELPVCTQTCYIEVTVPETLSTCFGVSDAEATAVVSGAFGTVNYAWNTSPAQTTQTATGLGVGEYVITVTDDNLCEASDTVEVIQNPEILIQVSGTDSLCLGVTAGSATAVATGGAGNFFYSWNTNPPQGTPTANNLSVGTYAVTVTDDVGCTEESTWVIEELPSVVVQASSGGDVCIGSTDGTATASASNGASPYQYSWNTNPLQTGTNATGLAPGDYQVTATDQTGCQGVGNVTIDALQTDSVYAGEDVLVCQGEQVELSASGAETYQWDAPISSQEAAVVVAPQSTTSYGVNALDANGCSSYDDVLVTVVEVPTLVVQNTDTVLCDVSDPIQIEGLPSGGEFSGSGISFDGMFDPEIAGDGVHSITYSYQVTEDCIAHVAASVIVDGNLCDIIVPSIFNPNTDFEGVRDFCGNVPQNNVFSLPCLELYPENRVRIFDRWGRKHYDQTNYHLNPWDGGNHSDGVFYYILEIPGESAKKGFFHLAH